MKLQDIEARLERSRFEHSTHVQSCRKKGCNTRVILRRTADGWQGKCLGCDTRYSWERVR